MFLYFVFLVVVQLILGIDFICLCFWVWQCITTNFKTKDKSQVNHNIYDIQLISSCTVHVHVFSSLVSRTCFTGAQLPELNLWFLLHQISLLGTSLMEKRSFQLKFTGLFKLQISIIPSKHDCTDVDFTDSD